MADKADSLSIHAHMFTIMDKGVGHLTVGAVYVQGSRITSAGATAKLAARHQARDVIDAIDCAVLAGLVDAHMHTPLAIIRVVAQGVA